MNSKTEKPLQKNINTKPENQPLGELFKFRPCCPKLVILQKNPEQRIMV